MLKRFSKNTWSFKGNVRKKNLRKSLGGYIYLCPLLECMTASIHINIMKNVLQSPKLHPIENYSPNAKFILSAFMKSSSQLDSRLSNII